MKPESAAPAIERKSFDDRVAYRMTVCKHFNGIQHDACEAGVKYDDLRPLRLPCLSQHVTTGEALTLPAAPCSKLERHAREDAEAVERARDEGIARFLADIQAGLCPHCRTRVESKRQVGACLYAVPCGCRLGQAARRRR